MKNSNNTIGNQTRDLSVCTAVPQPTAPLHVPNCNLKEINKHFKTVQKLNIFVNITLKNACYNSIWNLFLSSCLPSKILEIKVYKTGMLNFYIEKIKIN